MKIVLYENNALLSYVESFRSKETNFVLKTI